MFSLKYQFLFFCFFSFNVCSADINFLVKDDVKSFVSLTGKEGDYKLNYQISPSRQRGEFNVMVEGKNLKLISNDFNFDGNTDFALVYPDEGQGTTDIYRLYLYSEGRGFYEFNYKGEWDFPNLIVHKNTKKITYTCFNPVEVIPESCEINFTSTD